MADEAIEPARARASRPYLLGEILLVLFVGAVLVEAVSLGQILDGGWGHRLYSPMRTLVELGFIAWLLSLTGQNWRDLGVRRPNSWPRALGLGAAGFVAVFLVDQIVVRPALRAAGLQGGDIRGFAPLVGNVWEYLYWAGPMSLLVAAVGEELIGRAYLVSRIAALTGSDRRAAWVGAVLLSGILFGLGHAYQGLGGMIGTAVVGVLYGLLYLIGGRNIWPAMIAHGLSDVFGFTMIFAGAVDLAEG